MSFGGNNYCKSKRKKNNFIYGGPNHLLCGNYLLRNVSKCVAYENLTPIVKRNHRKMKAVQSEIVRIVNDFRQNVAKFKPKSLQLGPSKKILNRLVWDQFLMKSALAQANKCIEEGSLPINRRNGKEMNPIL